MLRVSMYVLFGMLFLLGGGQWFMLSRAGEASEEGPLALTNATVIDGTGAPPLEAATIVIEDGSISCVGACEVDSDAEVIDSGGQYIIPGLVDVHVHYWLSGWLDTFPGFDVGDRYPLGEMLADLRENPDRFHRSYVCSGVTAVFDVGGFPWSWDVRDEARHSTVAPHYAATGPLLTMQEALTGLDIPDVENLFVYMEDEATVRETVHMLAENGADAVKLHRPDVEEDRSWRQSLLGAARDEARRAGLPIIANAPTLESAKDVLRAGTSVLIYPVEDTLVDQEFLDLMRENDAVYVPAITVSEGAEEARTGAFQEERIPLDCVDSATREKVLLTNELPAVEEADTGVLPGRNETEHATRLENLRRVHEAGIAIASGSSSGSPLMLHGPATAYEMEAMVDAGLSPLDALVASTQHGARVMGRNDFGTLEEGKIADLVVLEQDPLADIRHVQSVEIVVRGGKVWTREELEYRDL